MSRLIFMCLFISFLANGLLAQGEDVWFEPNRGQWDSKILYKVGLVKGDFFVEKDKFTFALSDLGDVYHEAHTGGSVDRVSHHTIHSHFVNSSWQGEKIEKDSSEFYENYFLGSDSSKWQSRIHSYKMIELLDFYPGIDLILESSPEKIKYSFKVSPGVEIGRECRFQCLTKTYKEKKY